MNSLDVVFIRNVLFNLDIWKHKIIKYMRHSYIFKDIISQTEFVEELLLVTLLNETPLLSLFGSFFFFCFLPFRLFSFEGTFSFCGEIELSLFSELLFIFFL